MKKYLILAVSLIALFGFSPSHAFAAGCTGTGNCYWVDAPGTGASNWSNTAKWATTDGGSTTGGVPGTGDNVNFTVNASTTSYTVTVDATANANDMTWVLPSSGVPTLAGASALNIYGSLTKVASMGWTYSGTLTFSATATGKTITHASVNDAGPITFNGVGGGWTFQDNATTTNTMRLTAGTVDTNNKTIYFNIFASSGASSKTLTLGSSRLFFGGSTGDIWVVSGSNLNITANTATVTFPAGSSTLTGGGFNYNGLTILFNSTAESIKNANTFGHIKFLGTVSKTNSLTLYADQVTTDLTLAGADVAPDRLLVQSDTVGTPRTITTTNAPTITNVDFMDITCTYGGGNCTGTSVGNALGNSGIAFDTPTTRYARFGSNQNYSQTAMWSTSSGGAVGASVPLPQDTVIFDRNSATTTSKTITMDVPRFSADFNLDDAKNGTNAYTISFSSTANSIYGSWTGDPTRSTISGSQGLTFRGRSSTHTITSATKTFGVGGVTITMPGGTLTLTDAFSLSTVSNANNLTLNNGTFIDAGNTVNIPGSSGFTSTGSATRSLIKTGNWTVSNGNASTLWNVTSSLSLSDTAGYIKFSSNTPNTQTFAGGGLTYNDLWVSNTSVSGLTITGTNIFHDIKLNEGTVAHTITFPNATTVTTFTVAGTLGNLVTLQRTGASGGWGIAKSGGGTVCADYLSISNGTAWPINTFYAGTAGDSTDGGGNVLWNFTACPATPSTPAATPAKNQFKGGFFRFVGGIFRFR